MGGRNCAVLADVGLAWPNLVPLHGLRLASIFIIIAHTLILDLYSVCQCSPVPARGFSTLSQAWLGGSTAYRCVCYSLSKSLVYEINTGWIIDYPVSPKNCVMFTELRIRIQFCQWIRDLGRSGCFLWKLEVRSGVSTSFMDVLKYTIFLTTFC